MNSTAAALAPNLKTAIVNLTNKSYGSVARFSLKVVLVAWRKAFNLGMEGYPAVSAAGSTRADIEP